MNWQRSMAMGVALMGGLLGLAPQASAQSIPPAQGPAPTTTYYPPAQSELRYEPSSRPEEGPQVIVAYDMSFATRGLRDYVNDPSYRGVDVVNPWPVYRSLYLGPAFSYHLFHADDDRTFQLDSGALSGRTYRNAHMVEVSALVRYMFFKPGSVVRLYVGGRAGLGYSSTTTFVADLTASEDQAGFLAVGEGGMLVRLAPVLRFHLGVRHTYTTTESVQKGDNLSFLSAQAGLAIVPDEA